MRFFRKIIQNLQRKLRVTVHSVCLDLLWMLSELTQELFNIEENTSAFNLLFAIWLKSDNVSYMLTCRFLSGEKKNPKLLLFGDSTGHCLLSNLLTNSFQHPFDQLMNLHSDFFFGSLLPSYWFPCLLMSWIKILTRIHSIFVCEPCFQLFED